MDDSQLTDLEATLREAMPITAAMGIQTVDCRNGQLAMSMPLAENRNHQFSAFAGSLNALCTVVGWGAVFLMLRRRELSGNIVIRRSKIRYLRPVLSEQIIARALPHAETSAAYFYELLASKGRSKIDVDAHIADDQGPLVTFCGSYVVQD